MENFGEVSYESMELANKTDEFSKIENPSQESNVVGKNPEEWRRPEETGEPQLDESKIDWGEDKNPDIDDWKRPEETGEPQLDESKIDWGEDKNPDIDDWKRPEETGEPQLDESKIDWGEDKNPDIDGFKCPQEPMKETENVSKTETNSSAEKATDEISSTKGQEGKGDVFEAKQPIENKVAGLEREKEVKKDLEEKYPAEEGYEVVPETYLRDKDGNIVKDPETGEARRIDFVVVKDGKVVDSVEVTSKTADKTEQSAKEDRIREAGGNYIKDSEGNLVEIPSDVKTRIERRD